MDGGGDGGGARGGANGEANQWVDGGGANCSKALLKFETSHGRVRRCNILNFLFAWGV